MSFLDLRKSTAILFAALALAAAASPSKAVNDSDGHTAPAVAPVLPASADLGYRTTATMKLMGLPVTLHGRTTIRWRLEGAHYETRLHIDTGGFDQFSRGQLAADGALQPQRYEEKRPFHEPDYVDIDWAHGRIQYGASAPTQAPAAGAQDRLSLIFELSRQLQSFSERFVSGSVHTAALIGTHDIDVWRIVCEDEKSVDTGKGSMRAVRFSARRSVGSLEETMDIWLGADLRWMPIRIHIVDRKGSIIDSVLEDAVVP